LTVGCNAFCATTGHFKHNNNYSIDESGRFKSFPRRDAKGCFPIIDDMSCRAAKIYVISYLSIALTIVSSLALGQMMDNLNHSCQSTQSFSPSENGANPTKSGFNIVAPEHIERCLTPCPCW
jgi:hypothetical protein